MRLDRDELLRRVAAEEQPQPIQKLAGGRQLVDHSPVVPQHSVQARVRQRDAGEHLADVAELSGGLAQELAADGGVQEELPDFDLRADGTAAGLHRPHVAPHDW